MRYTFFSNIVPGAMLQLLLLFGFFSLGVCLPRQYHFINENKTWAEAQRYCRENYDDLASINNTEEELALTNIIDIWNNNRTWIGLYDDLKSWKWSLDDDSFFQEGERSFRNWYIQKPRNSNGNSLCVYLSGYSGVWYEASCSLRLPFICFDGSVNASERYVLVNQNLNWTEAQRYCRKNYADLTSVRNETENQMIRSLLPNIYYYYYGLWIGLYRTRSWSDKSNSSFTNWKPGQPDNYAQNESCTAVSFNSDNYYYYYNYNNTYLYYGKWTDENCGQAFPFLCYSIMTSTSRQYHFISENKTWTEAQRYCRENYTDLATTDNMEEMNTLLNTVNGSYSGLAWIGLYDDLDSWRWSLDDDAFYQEGEKDFRGWYHQPDNYYGQELCVSMISTGEWFDSPCTDRKSFVCYNDTTNTYVWIYNATTWEEAQSFCRANHTDLASVRNETELQQILNIMNSYGYSEAWIGLYRNRLWSDQSNSTFTFWSPEIPAPPPEPDNGVYSYSPGQYRNQHCTAVDHSGRWTDENCFTSFPFICYTAFTPGVVTGLQMKVKAEESLLYSEIERIVLMELQQESVRLGLSSNFSVNAIKIRKISP
ncbi:macrophage mannose receptor 1 isoform X2 [Ictalurus punctatus]|uniref:Macrophage mannose receptor 1 isoform X2 n=1 Tax=Ictalurus punctatus TaxID=7998 RepID=A0A9F7RV12_ICTPU|nr:macrophage mannose receptor 1 isoform X2 [Ictalurus punctatus]